MIAALFLILLVAYMACGLVFAIPFVLVGVKKIDPHAAHGSWGFRLLVIPGAMAFWPLLLRRWASGVHEPPRNATRTAVSLQPNLITTLKPRARSETVQNHQLKVRHEPTCDSVGG